MLIDINMLSLIEKIKYFNFFYLTKKTPFDFCILKKKI